MKPATRPLLLLIVAQASVFACADPGQRAQRPLGPVVREALAVWDGRVPAETQLAAPDGELRERMRGLVELLASSRPGGEMASVAREDAQSAPPEGVLVLCEVLSDATSPRGTRRAAADLMVALATRQMPARQATVMALTSAMEQDADAGVREACARSLGRLDRDEALPRLLLRLKYEEDSAAALGLALALADLGNGAGLDLIRELERSASTDLDLARAQAILPDLLDQPTVGAALDAWRSGDLDLLEPSPALHLAVWRLIGALHGERIQLRGVDDARFVLARLGPWASALLGEALRDEDLYVRVHAAQCLGRMGRRAAPARASLLAALRDPLLAPAAAEALGASWAVTPAREGADPLGAGVGDALRARLSPETESELRASAVRALGMLGQASSVAPLRKLFDGDLAPTLRVGVATSLVRLGEGAPVVAHLAQELSTERGPIAEAALDLWMRDGAAPGLAAAWFGLAPAPGVIPTHAEARERRALRARLLTAAPGDK